MLYLHGAPQLCKKKTSTERGYKVINQFHSVLKKILYFTSTLTNFNCSPYKTFNYLLQFNLRSVDDFYFN